MIVYKLTKKIVLTLVLVGFSSSVSAALLNSDIKIIEAKHSIAATISAVSSQPEQWFNYQVEMEPNNGMPCCLTSGAGSECSLDRRSNDWSSSSDYENSTVLAIYFKMQGKKLSDLFYAGSQCKVEGKNYSVYRINNVSQKASIAFLNELVSGDTAKVRDHQEIVHKAIAGIAMHEGDKAQEVLETYSNGDDQQLKHEAIFWFGQARNKPGYERLLEIIENDNHADKDRAHAVFALSLNSYEGSAQKLIEFAKSHLDEQIQAESIFWLSQHHSGKAIAVIQTVLDHSSSNHVRKKAVFSLAQLKTQTSWDTLVSIAKSNQDRAIQEEAIFWLSQNVDQNPVAVLIGLAMNDNPASIIEKAIFSLSQLPGHQSTPALISLIQTSQDKRVRKKAMFWLGQSDDPKALVYLEQILTASSN